MSELTPTPDELVEDIQLEIDDAEVIPAPVDPTLSHEGEAADAKAVGDGLAERAKSVNDQVPDSEGNIALDATQIPVSDEEGAQSVAEVIIALQGVTADSIHRTDENNQTVEEALAALETGYTDEEIDGLFEEEEA